MKLPTKYFAAQLAMGNWAAQDETTGGEDNVHEVSVELFAAHSLCMECILPA